MHPSFRYSFIHFRCTLISDRPLFCSDIPISYTLLFGLDTPLFQIHFFALQIQPYFRYTSLRFKCIPISDRPLFSSPLFHTHFNSHTSLFQITAIYFRHIHISDRPIISSDTPLFQIHPYSVQIHPYFRDNSI